MVTIRSAARRDVATLAELLRQLGYPAKPDEVTARLGRLDQFNDAVALVAEFNGQVVGLATGHVFPSIHSTPPVAWITTLVVDEQHQQARIGAQLVSAVEAWAQAHGAARISVTSGKHREGAHAFYERIGYERTGLRLSRTLS